MNKNENFPSPRSRTHSSSPTRALTSSSPSNASFALLPHFFLSSATPCSTPILHTTKLSPTVAITASPLPLHSLLDAATSSHSSHCATFVTTLHFSSVRTNNSFTRSAANPSHRQHLHTLPGRPHASNTSWTSYSPHHRAEHLISHTGLCCTRNSTIKG